MAPYDIMDMVYGREAINQAGRILQALAFLGSTKAAGGDAHE